MDTTRLTRFSGEELLAHMADNPTWEPNLIINRALKRNFAHLTGNNLSVSDWVYYALKDTDTYEETLKSLMVISIPEGYNDDLVQTDYKDAVEYAYLQRIDGKFPFAVEAEVVAKFNYSEVEAMWVMREANSMYEEGIDL